MLLSDLENLDFRQKGQFLSQAAPHISIVYALPVADRLSAVIASGCLPLVSPSCVTRYANGASIG